jgi:hypothetical protein
VLIDVMPAEGGFAMRMACGIWRPRPSLPGAHWFPEAGGRAGARHRGLV